MRHSCVVLNAIVLRRIGLEPMTKLLGRRHYNTDLLLALLRSLTYVYSLPGVFDIVLRYCTQSSVHGEIDPDVKNVGDAASARNVKTTSLHKWWLDGSMKTRGGGNVRASAPRKQSAIGSM